jgi:hypothetical protein
LNGFFDPDRVALAVLSGDRILYAASILLRYPALLLSAFTPSQLRFATASTGSNTHSQIFRLSCKMSASSVMPGLSGWLWP